MNCANHPERERTAFCQNCGKPLCAECTRPVGSSVFCEPCLTARVASPGYIPPSAPHQPNPGLAALLGFIPGVGAMYNEQYGKGIVHLIVFALLVSLSHESGIFGLIVFGWIVYQVIEAHHTARARRDGTPLPNPFGLNDIAERLGFGRAWPAPPGTPFTPNPDPASTGAPGANAGYSANPGAAYGAASSLVDPLSSPPSAGPYTPPYTYVPPVSQWGAAQDYAYNPPPVPPVPPMPPYADPNAIPSTPYTRRFPAGAVWLIGLGVVFLLANSGLFNIRARYLGPLLLIGLGAFLFVRRMTSTGVGVGDDGAPNYQWRLLHAIHTSIWVILTGVLWLLDSFHILSWGSSWPIFLIAGGVVAFFRHAMPAAGPVYNPYPGYPAPPPTAPPTVSTAIVPTRSDSGQEGR